MISRLSSPLIAFCIAALCGVHAEQQPAQEPFRLAIGGLVHGHVSGFLRAAGARKDVQIVGLFDPDASLLRSYGQRHSVPDRALFTDLGSMLDRVRPEAVATFTSTSDHPAVVEAAAARGVYVMMEKPLAVSNADGERIRRAAERGWIQVNTRKQSRRDRNPRGRARVGAQAHPRPPRP